MDNNLTKEQLLLLQHNLTYEVYEEFMSMFDRDETLPEDKEERGNYILETMKEHPFWGEIMGWGDKRVYKHICLPNVIFPESESTLASLVFSLDIRLDGSSTVSAISSFFSNFFAKAS